MTWGTSVKKMKTPPMKRTLKTFLVTPQPHNHTLDNTYMSSKTRRLTKLSDALDALEDKLESLLSSTLVETGASLETLQEAKLNTVLPYLINDLIFSKP